MPLTTKFSRAVIAYLILILLWCLSWLTLGDATWILALINRGAVPFLFLPVGLFGIISIFLHRYRALLLLLLPTLIFASLYYPYLIPRLPTCPHPLLPFSPTTSSLATKTTTPLPTSSSPTNLI